MTTQNQEPADRKEFIWLVEQEKFRDNIRTFQRISQEMAAKTDEFNKLFEEAQWARAETRVLRRLLDKTALQVGLQPLPVRKN